MSANTSPRPWVHVQVFADGHDITGNVQKFPGFDPRAVIKVGTAAVLFLTPGELDQLITAAEKLREELRPAGGEADEVEGVPA